MTIASATIGSILSQEKHNLFIDKDWSAGDVMQEVSRGGQAVPRGGQAVPRGGAGRLPGTAFRRLTTKHKQHSINFRVLLYTEKFYTSGEIPSIPSYTPFPAVPR